MSFFVCLVFLFSSGSASASMEKGYPASQYCLDIEIRTGSTGQTRNQIARHYPGKFLQFTNCSFIRKSVHARKHRRKASGWGAIGFHVYQGIEDTSCPSGHRRGVIVQSTVTKIGYWNKIRDFLPQVTNPANGKVEPYVLCAAEGNLLMKNGVFEKNNQGFSNHDRNHPHRRPVIAIKANQCIYQGYMYGSSYQIYRQLKRAGFVDAIALDSGSSTAPGALVYDIIGIVDKQSKRFQNFEEELKARENRTMPSGHNTTIHTHLGDVIDHQSLRFHEQRLFSW